MKKYTGLFTTVLFSLALLLSSVPDAEARRFGAGGSFGGKSSYSKPFRRSANTTPKRSASQQKAYNHNQAVRQGMSRRGGFMGMLGGLALGGMLGSMLFGGAFEGINLMDILLFAGIGYLLYKLFAAKTRAKHQAVYSRENYGDEAHLQVQSFSTGSKQSSADFDTDILFKQENKQTSYSNKRFQGDSGLEENFILAGFDESSFLEGAREAYKDLQKAWDNRDLAEIRGLTTDKVFANIQNQLKASNKINQTDVLQVGAELLSVREIGSELESVVLFDAIIREDSHGHAEQVREVWHFIKLKNSLQSKWFLDGIQQLEQ